MRRGKRPNRVLLIEDDELQAEALKEALDTTGSVVEVAHTGSEGLDKARRFCPDIVLCDLGLPDFDGDEVARRMRADPKLRSVRLWALSAHVLPEDRERTKRAGFDEHLSKPPAFDVLQEKFAEVKSERDR